MQAAVGDRLHVHASTVGQPERTGEIVEVRGPGGEPPYLVRFDNGHTALVFPGPDAIIEHPRGKRKKGPPLAGPPRGSPIRGSLAGDARLARHGRDLAIATGGPVVAGDSASAALSGLCICRASPSS